MEEQGVNTLYLALGMLSWREEDNNDKFSRAPLILIPVELGRSDARDRFHLKYTGEELGENVSLAEKLKQSFGIKEFPDLPEADDVDVDDYFQKVQRSVIGRAGWTVDTDAIALGFFSFAKFLMYRDLDPKTWPATDAILWSRDTPVPASRGWISTGFIQLQRRPFARRSAPESRRHLCWKDWDGASTASGPPTGSITPIRSCEKWCRQSRRRKLLARYRRLRVCASRTRRDQLRSLNNQARHPARRVGWCLRTNARK